jgi:DNA-binding MarR family transcriptional regulator
VPDAVDRILAQWREQRPDLDTSTMGVVGRLSRVAQHVAVRQRDTFARHGLDGPTFDVLATLRRSPAPHRLTPADLTEASMVTTGATTQRLDRLEERGLVTRGPRPEDGRGVLVTLTPAGARLVDAALPDHLATQQAVVRALDPGERRELARLLATLLADLEAGTAD